MMRLLSFALACAGLVSCASKPIERPATIQFAEVVEPGTAGGKEYRLAAAPPEIQATLCLLEPVSFAVELASVGIDALGYRAINVEISEPDKARLRAWSAERVGKGIALLVDGEIRTVATLNDELPGHVMVSAGGEGFSEAEARALVDRLNGLTPDAKSPETR